MSGRASCGGTVGCFMRTHRLCPRPQNILGEVRDQIDLVAQVLEHRGPAIERQRFVDPAEPHVEVGVHGVEAADARRAGLGLDDRSRWRLVGAVAQDGRCRPEQARDGCQEPFRKVPATGPQPHIDRLGRGLEIAGEAHLIEPAFGRHVTRRAHGAREPIAESGRRLRRPHRK